MRIKKIKKEIVVGGTLFNVLIEIDYKNKTVDVFLNDELTHHLEYNTKKELRQFLIGINHEFRGE